MSDKSRLETAIARYTKLKWCGDEKLRFEDMEIICDAYIKENEALEIPPQGKGYSLDFIAKFNQEAMSPLEWEQWRESGSD